MATIATEEGKDAPRGAYPFTVERLVQVSGEIAREKGWGGMTPEMFLTWAHSELSEAFTLIRKGKRPDESWEENGKPEGVPAEVADVFILLAHFMFESLGENAGRKFEDELIRKLNYNRTRPKNHGHQLHHFGAGDRFIKED